MSADLSLAIGDRGLSSFALAFAITQLVEVPIYVRALRGAESKGTELQGAKSRRAESQGAESQGAESQGAEPQGTESRPWQRRALIGFGASLITHPIVWFAMPAISMFFYEGAVRRGFPVVNENGRTWLYGAVAEGFAVIVEALYLKAFRATRPLVWSLLANVASVVVGTIVARLL